MKKTRLITACLIALSAVSMFGAAAYAADIIDFEDGRYSFATMKTDDGGDPSELSVADFNGSKQLKVDVTDCKNVPKVYFDLNSILKMDDLDKVNSIEMDITIESKDGVTPPGWAGGAIGTQGGKAKTPDWAQTPWETGEYDNAVSKPVTIRRKFLLYSERLVNDTPDTHMILMKWGSEVDYNMYVDNIRFLDVDEEPIALSIESEYPKEEVTEAESPVTEKEPESDNDTLSSTTGNVSALAAASAAVLSGYAALMTGRKRRKKHNYKNL